MGWIDRLSWWRSTRQPVNENRWIMLDVETSGLDPHHDRLLAIAAIALRVDWVRGRMSIDLGDSFEIDLRQEEVTSTKDNILLHGIGVQRQREGVAPSLALRSFADFVADSPMLAFHAAFDQAMIKRHSRQHLNRIPSNPWVDVEHLCAMTFEGVKARSLDEWMQYFRIECAVRHQAAADTLAECELLLRIWPRLSRQCHSWRDVEKLAALQRWIHRT